mmetsp:Transcript_65237/g.170881  ORF Transcript_65237/g.170881 Transcript_65237/m.170881 type:complete len:321 (+) Transcript_65237:1005-1967(+)
MPRFVLTNWSLDILLLTLGLCWSVWSMMSENASTKAVSELENLPGLSRQYFCANSSIMRSIFCASPGSLKILRNCRSASSSSITPNSRLSMRAFKTLVLSGLFSPRKSPSEVLSIPTSMFLKNSAMAMGSSVRKPYRLRCSMPRLGFMLNLLMPIASSRFRCFSSMAVAPCAGSGEAWPTVESVFSPSSSSVSSVFATSAAAAPICRDRAGSSAWSSEGFAGVRVWSSPSRCDHSTTELTSFTSACRASMRISRSCCGLMRATCSLAVYLPCAILDRQSMMRSKMFFSSTSQSKFKKSSTAEGASEQSLKKACSERYLCS